MVRWDYKTDVLVVGSGGAALVAAILAHDNGARVSVIEKTDKVGGTTAVSGGGIWIPQNHHMSELGICDSREEALAYCRRLSAGRSDDEQIVTFVDTAPKALRYLEEHTPARFMAQSMPDYHPEEEGGKPGARMVEPTLFDTSVLGKWARRLRPGRVFGLPATVEELFVKFRAIYRPQNLPIGLINERTEKGIVATGNALVGMLLKGCLDRDIPILLETRAIELIQKSRRVVGVRAEQDGKSITFGAGAVVLASGGYEWNPDLRLRFLPGPISHPNSPPANEGDGLLMAMAVGADLVNMSEAWWFPSVVDPTETYDGKPLARLAFAERTAPHSIMVNRFGRRFVNEAANYNDVGKSFNVADSNGPDYVNSPSWIIFDAQYREKYGCVTITPNDPDPDWLYRADSLEGLASTVGVDADNLVSTVNRFNGFVQEGIDRDFHRGRSIYDQYMGDSEAPHPTLGTLEKPPFYALPVYPGALGTKGGPRTNTEGQVLDVWGNPIPGLYGAGNVIGGLSGPGYFGGGGTIAPAVTGGYLCGIHAAKEARANPVDEIS